MTIGPISGIGVTPSGTSGVGSAARGVDAGDKAGFGKSVTAALDELDRLHTQADSLATQAATGDLESVTDYLVAATEAQLATQVTAAVRNRAVEAFNDIMRMPV